MTRNYDGFFVFGKEKKLYQIKFFWGVGEVEDAGVRCQGKNIEAEISVFVIWNSYSSSNSKQLAILTGKAIQR
jgi:hypothetical protein